MPGEESRSASVPSKGKVPVKGKIQPKLPPAKPQSIRTPAPKRYLLVLTCDGLTTVTDHDSLGGVVKAIRTAVTEYGADVIQKFVFYGQRLRTSVSDNQLLSNVIEDLDGTRVPIFRAAAGSLTTEDDGFLFTPDAEAEVNTAAPSQWTDFLAGDMNV